MHLCYYSSTDALSFAFAGWLLLVSVTATDECVKGVEVSGNVPTDDWPELYRLTTPYPEDPTLSNMDTTAGFVDPAVLLAAGVTYRYLDPSGYDYPNGTAFPWIPSANETNDVELQTFRDDNDFQYADIVVVEAYNEGFYEEHLHPGGSEIRYVIDGVGYFDIRDVNDEWVRMHAKAGAFVEFPSGIQHRFAVDETMYIQAMRLFPGSGEPDWSSVSRSQVNGNSTARTEYVNKYLCGVDPDLEDHGHETEEEKMADSPVEGEQMDNSSVEGEQMDDSPVEGEQMDESPVEGEKMDDSPVEGEKMDDSPVEGENTDGSPVEDHDHETEGEKIDDSPVEGEGEKMNVTSTDNHDHDDVDHDSSGFIFSWSSSITVAAAIVGIVLV